MVTGRKILYYSALTTVLFYFLISGLIEAKPFLAPLAVAAILALLVLPLNRKMEQTRINRPWASLINTFFLFLVSLGFFALLSMQIKNVIDDWPEIKDTMKPKVEQLKMFILEHTPLSEQDLNGDASNGTFSFMGQSSNTGQRAATVFNQTLSFFGTYLLTFIYIFFLLNYRHHFKVFLLKLFPDKEREHIQKVVTESAKITQDYLLGKLMLIGFLAIFYAVGLGISGVNNFILISLLAALFSIVPYIGNIIGFGMAMVFGYLTSGNPSVLIGITVTFSLGQFVESYIMEPYIVGDKVDLHPFIVILVVVIANFIWGLVGMIVAIPILAIINIVFLNVASLKPFGYLLSKKGKVS